jgi:protein-tyrosine phosphatase
MAQGTVLFVCYGNLCRSPMAEGFFNALRTSNAVAAESAGVGAVAGSAPSLLAVLEMKRRGIDISGHRARGLAAVDPAACVAVVALDREVAALLSVAFPELPGLRVWNVPDPYGGSAGGYRQAAEMIRAQVEDLLEELD